MSRVKWGSIQPVGLIWNCQRTLAEEVRKVERRGCQWASARAVGTHSAHIPWRGREWGAVRLRGRGQHRPMCTNKCHSALFLNSVRVKLSGRLGGMGSPPRVPHGGDEREKCAPDLCAFLPAHWYPHGLSTLPHPLWSSERGNHSIRPRRPGAASATLTGEPDTNKTAVPAKIPVLTPIRCDFMGNGDSVIAIHAFLLDMISFPKKTKGAGKAVGGAAKAEKAEGRDKKEKKTKKEPDMDKIIIIALWFSRDDPTTTPTRYDPVDLQQLAGATCFKKMGKGPQLLVVILPEGENDIYTKVKHFGDVTVRHLYFHFGSQF
ncbi:hypothetical protein B0H14DRAFT_2617434 [Mycena olivaceomarginata]|nr:hypothetical protein B0H14DRAFT_2617434 [Mycena olivaceomarginata]